MLVFQVPTGMSAKAVARRCLWLAFCQSKAVGLGVLHMAAAGSITEDDLEKKHLLDNVSEYVSDYIAGRMVKLAVKYDESKGVVSMRDGFHLEYQSFAPVYPTPMDLFTAAVSSIQHEATGVSTKQEAKQDGLNDLKIPDHPLMQFFQQKFDEVEKAVDGFPSRALAAMHFWNNDLKKSAREEFTRPCGRPGCDCHAVKSKQFDECNFDEYIRVNYEPVIVARKYHAIAQYLEFAWFICATLSSVTGYSGHFLKAAMRGETGPYKWGSTIETTGEPDERAKAFADIDYLFSSIGINHDQWKEDIVGDVGKSALGDLDKLLSKKINELMQGK